MIRTNMLQETENKKVTATKGCFVVLEYMKDISVHHSTAMEAYYASMMNVHKKQLIANLNNNSVIIQAGAMQMMLGNIQASSDIKGLGDLVKKSFSSKATGETAVKPKYSGVGQLVLEPTYKHIILQDLAEWGGSMVIDDGLFLACESTVDMKVVARTNLSSALAGGEGLFNTCFTGKGVVALESKIPYDELIVFDLENDCIKIDGNMAVAWSNSLQFTVEKTTKSIVGSVASGEGLVNVYKGTGRILVAPVC
ncbi:MAG: AIM24 family protein [Oscillospiraceae bacterium]